MWYNNNAQYQLRAETASAKCLTIGGLLLFIERLMKGGDVYGIPSGTLLHRRYHCEPFEDLSGIP